MRLTLRRAPFSWKGMEGSGATSASTTRGGRREDSVPDERAKPKRHFIRFLPPPADIKLNLFQFDLNRVTTETLPLLCSDFTRENIVDLSISPLSGAFHLKWTIKRMIQWPFCG